jgi:ATP-dependent protease ClpP protease subunit/uncharacterized small protein (DUF1192 family)
MIKNTSTNYLGMENPSNYPSIHIKQLVSNEYTVHFSQEFEHPSYYDEVVTLLMQAEEGDRINFMINNFGGRVDALNAILNSLAMTRAEVTGFLIGQGCSCSSVLLLACHNWVIGDNTTLMIHEQSFGTYGKASESKKQHDHYQKQNERFIRNAYQFFLTPEEVENCLRGEDYYFEDFEIRERLQKREQLRAEAIQESLEQEPDLSQFSVEELEEELVAIADDVKKIKSEIKKRKV